MLVAIIEIVIDAQYLSYPNQKLFLPVIAISRHGNRVDEIEGVEADLSRDKSASSLFPMLMCQIKAVHHNRLLIKSNIANESGC